LISICCDENHWARFSISVSLSGFSADSTGRRNTFTNGGVYGPTCWLDAEFDWASGDAITWRAVSQA
jgi:hypothetical protein